MRTPTEEAKKNIQLTLDSNVKFDEKSE